MRNQVFYDLENVIHAWEEAGKYGDLQTRMSRAKRWNAYYAHLAKKAEQTESTLDLRPDYFTEQLFKNEAIKDTDHVIDICAGGGRYTLQFAGKCNRVTALDSCPENLGLIRRRAEAMHLQNVDCQIGFWEAFETVIIRMKGFIDALLYMKMLR